MMVQHSSSSSASSSMQILQQRCPPQPPPPSAPMNTMFQYRRQQSFTSRILKHGGPARDTTIQAATKATAREKSHFTKTFSQMDDIMAEFAAEMAVIERIKKEVISNQQQMAQRSLEWYSAVSIQMLYRRMRSKLILKALKKGRLIANWLRFRVYFRYRCAKAKQICRWVKRKLILHTLYNAIRSHLAAYKIQKYFRNSKKTMYLFNSIKILLTVKNTRDHCLLFGTRRAFQHFMRIKERETTEQLFSGEYTYAEINRIRKCLATWIQRRKWKL